MARYVDRYLPFRENGKIKTLPGIKLPEASTDLSYVYKQGTTRLDKLSNMFYNNAWSGWLILLANPQFGGLEFNIPDMTLIKVPYPYDDAMKRYSDEINKYRMLYGI
jgi:hypothetical protein